MKCRSRYKWRTIYWHILPIHSFKKLCLQKTLSIWLYLVIVCTEIRVCEQNQYACTDKHQQENAGTYWCVHTGAKYVTYSSELDPDIPCWLPAGWPKSVKSTFGGYIMTTHTHPLTLKALNASVQSLSHSLEISPPYPSLSWCKACATRLDLSCILRIST